MKKMYGKETLDSILEVYADVGVRNCYWEKDRYNLNLHKSRLDKKESPV